MMRSVHTFLMATLLVSHYPCAPALAGGVGNSTCASEGMSEGRQFIAVTSSGLSRSVLVFVPAAAAARRALPLVLDLHGSGGNGEEQAASSRLADVAAKNGFVVANPSGGVISPNDPNKHYWNIPGAPLFGGGDTPTNAPDDVQFISDALDQIAAKTCIDANRIYVAGFSGGGRMTSLLGCRLSTRIAAIAPVSGLRAGLPSAENPAQPDPGTCQPLHAMPVVSFHGTADKVNPYDGGGSPYWAYGIPTALHRWAELDHCKDRIREQHVAPHVTLLRYERCAAGAEVWLYRTDETGEQGGGHAWPGAHIPLSPAAGIPPEALRSNKPGTEINASELMWQFFKRYRLPTAPEK